MTKQLLLFDDFYKKPAPPAKGFRQWLRRLFFGDDIFISYSRADSGKYATALAVKMSEQGYLCFLDQLGTDVNRNMPDSLKTKVRASTALVLIGTEGAAVSRYVREEVDIFKESKRPIHPISVDDALSKEEWPELAGLSWIPESLKNVAEGKPSEGTITQLKNSTRYRRRNQWLRLSLITGFSIVALMLVVAATSYASSVIAGAQAAEATAEKITAVKAADDAAKREGEATAKQQEAAIQERLAEGNADNAAIQATEAIKTKDLADEQRKMAEGRMAEAQRLELEARENAAEAARLAKGSSASVLARVPGQDFKALQLAVEAAVPEMKKSASNLAAPIAKGLVDSVMAVDDGIQLRNVKGDVTYTQISPDACFVFVETLERTKGIWHWGVWDARTGKFLKQLDEEKGYEPSSYARTLTSVISVSFSRDGNRVAASDPVFLRVWDLRKAGDKPLFEIHPDSIVENVALNSDGSCIALINKARDHRMFVSERKVSEGKTDDPNAERMIDQPFGPYDLRSVLFSQDDELLIDGVKNDPQDPTKSPSYIFDPAKNHRYIYHSKTKTLQGSNYSDELLGVSSEGRPFFKYDPSVGPVKTFPSEEKQLIYSLTPDLLNQEFFSGYAGDISSAAIVGKRAYVVTIDGGQARIHGARNYEDFATLRIHDEHLRFGVFSPDGSRALTADNFKLALWDVHTGKLLRLLEDEGWILSATTAFAFSTGGRRFAAISHSSHPEVWNLLTGENLTHSLSEKIKQNECATPLEVPSVKAMAFLAPDNQKLIVSYRDYPDGKIDSDNDLLIWDMQRCAASKPFKIESGSDVEAFSQDGTMAVSISPQYSGDALDKNPNRMLTTWDLRGMNFDGDVAGSPTPNGRWPLPSDRVLAVSFHEGTVKVLLQKDDLGLEVWQSGDGKITELKDSESKDWEGEVLFSSWSCDGSKLVVIGKTGMIHVWDAANGRQLISIPFPAEDYPMNPVTLSPDGSSLIIVNTDGAARILPTTSTEFLNVANRILVQ
ncbi:MAG TPA: TIR domain-containing protein [Pyrinomonadaceae bacterium]|nr:TIR domain-containing protein [Pyrinomonadaceae bacterium]